MSIHARNGIAVVFLTLLFFLTIANLALTQAAAAPGVTATGISSASVPRPDQGHFDGLISPPCAPAQLSWRNLSKGSLPLVKHVRCEVPPGGLPRITPLPVTDPQPTPDPDPQPQPGEPGTPTDPAPNPEPTPVPEPTPTDPVTDPGTDPTPQPPFVDPGFRYYPPGDLIPQDAGRGRKDRKVWLPDMIFPLKLGENEHPHMNSQIWGYGGGGWGGKGAAGGRECDPRNYDPMQQRDNYCEVRGWKMPLCPAGKGHQGQDIRAPSCKDNKWEVVAVVDGKIDMRTRNTTVRLVGKDGTKYRYLHMHPRSIRVSVGQRVKQGDVLGRISRFMGGKRATSTHLHFDVTQKIKIGNRAPRTVYVPLYTSLIAAYRHAKGLDRGIDSDGNLIAQYPLEIGVPAPPEPEPTPTEPTDPTPSDPTPTQPTEPTDPTPSEPTPAEPTEPPPSSDRTWWQWGKDTIKSWTDWWYS